MKHIILCSKYSVVCDFLYLLGRSKPGVKGIKYHAFFCLSRFRENESIEKYSFVSNPKIRLLVLSGGGL